MQAAELVGPVVAQAVLPAPGPSCARLVAKPLAGYEVEYSMFAVTSVRTEAAPEDSLAAILARSRFGIAIAAMIRMIATTMSSSINDNPLCCLRISKFLPSCGGSRS